MIAYLDSSFVVALYVAEGRSAAAAQVLRTMDQRPAISVLTDIEVASAVYRKGDPSRAQAAQRLYRQDRAAGVYQELELEPAIYERARLLAGGVAGRHLLRSMDLLHLAIAQHYRVAALATFDKRLAKAAESLGLEVLSAQF